VTPEAPKVLDPRPGPLGRMMARPLFWVAIVVLLAMVPIARALGRERPEPPPRYLTLPAFELENQHGLAFGSRELVGKVWVASFVFTSCPAVCPGIMERMAEVQHRTRNAGAAVHLVTFTVDPETDTAERLQEYGKRFKASPYRWSLLTGKLDTIESTVVGGFKLAMGKDAESLMQIFHSERLVLVDREGTIRGYYEANEEGVDRLVRDIGLVLNLGP
jgi:protein SCO1/2